MNTASESDASISAKVIGIVTIILGIAALAAPFVIGESLLLFVGLVVTGAGVLRMIWALRTDSFRSGVWRFLVGVLTLLAGVFILGHPLLASGALTLILAGYLFLDGLVEFIVALTLERSRGKGWLLAGGLLSIFLAWLLFFQMPFSGVTAIGILMGVKLIFIGLIALLLGTTLHDLARVQGT
jgi:uncharacterized membrane protein HdeD (DUF308 family)